MLADHNTLSMFYCNRAFEHFINIDSGGAPEEGGGCRMSEFPNGQCQNFKVKCHFLRAMSNVKITKCQCQNFKCQCQMSKFQKDI